MAKTRIAPINRKKTSDPCCIPQPRSPVPIFCAGPLAAENRVQPKWHAIGLGSSKLAVPSTALRGSSQRCCTMVGQNPDGSADPARVHVEIGLLALDLRLYFAAADVLPQAAHVPAAFAVEDLQRRKHLQHGQQAPVGVVLTDPALPLAADGEHLAVEMADRLALLVIE